MVGVGKSVLIVGARGTVLAVQKIRAKSAHGKTCNKWGTGIILTLFASQNQKLPL